MEREEVRRQVEVEIGYKKRDYPKNTCGNCPHTVVTNAGAVYPGLRCELMAKKSQKFTSEYANCQVRSDAVCELYDTLVLEG